MNINLLISQGESQVLSLDSLVRKYPRGGHTLMATSLNETYSATHNTNQNISNQIGTIRFQPSVRQPYEAIR